MNLVLKLLPGKHQPLLTWSNLHFVLDLGFDIVGGVRGRNCKGDGCYVSYALRLYY
jgi:hypothetical protein